MGYIFEQLKDRIKVFGDWTEKQIRQDARQTLNDLNKILDSFGTAVNAVSDASDANYESLSIGLDIVEAEIVDLQADVLALQSAVPAIPDPWATQPIGVYIAVKDDTTGIAPPTNQAYRYVKLTAADSAYNSTFLTSESVSGSAPAVQATAVISSVGSPLHGVTIRLINTERRVLRAGAVGTVEADAFASHLHTGTADSAGAHVHTGTADSAGAHVHNNPIATSGGGAVTVLALNPATGAAVFAYQNPTQSAGAHTHPLTIASGGAHTHPLTIAATGGTETRGKNLGVTYYMRIK